MFILKPGTKQDPIRRWNLSDRAFFGHGACHILAQAFIDRFPTSGYYPIWIKPDTGYRGNHVFVTNGLMAFDYRGYLTESRLTSYYRTIYELKYPGWGAEMVRVEANLRKPEEMKKIGMHIRGPDDFLHNPIPRAKVYLSKYDKMHEYQHA